MYYTVMVQYGTGSQHRISSRVQTTALADAHRDDASLSLSRGGQDGGGDEGLHASLFPARPPVEQHTSLFHMIVLPRNEMWVDYA